jgi:hypothetical protein
MFIPLSPWPKLRYFYVIGKGHSYRTQAIQRRHVDTPSFSASLYIHQVGRSAICQKKDRSINLKVCVLVKTSGASYLKIY